jgi:predicted ATP-grasp superfamily ATP-dependent carboligase
MFTEVMKFFVAKTMRGIFGDISYHIERCGGVVVGRLAWKSELFSRINEFRKTGVDYLLVDNDLFGGSLDGDISWQRYIQSSGINRITTIGVSSCPMPGLVDFDLQKINLQNLPELIGRIQGHKNFGE